MDTKSSLPTLLGLGLLILLFGHITLAACPDNGTPVLQMCTSNALTVFGAYLDSRGMTTGYLECQCSVVSNTNQDVTVTSVTSPTPPDCTYQDVLSDNSISGNTGNWTCDNVNGFPGVLEPIRQSSKLAFALRRRDPKDNSTDSGYCILLTAQSLITVICGENVTTAAPTTPIPQPTRDNQTVNVFPLPRKATTTTTTLTTTPASTATTSTLASTSTSSSASSSPTASLTPLSTTSLSSTLIPSTSSSTLTSTPSTVTSSVSSSTLTETTKLSSEMFTVARFPFISDRVTPSSSSSSTRTSELTTDTSQSMSSTFLVNEHGTSRTQSTIDHESSASPTSYETATMDDLITTIPTEKNTNYGASLSPEMVTVKRTTIGTYSEPSSESVESPPTGTATRPYQSVLSTDTHNRFKSNKTTALSEFSKASTTDEGIKGTRSASSVKTTDEKQTMSFYLSTDETADRSGTEMSSSSISKQEQTTQHESERKTVESSTIMITTDTQEPTPETSNTEGSTLKPFPVISEWHMSSLDTTDTVVTDTLSTLFDSTFALETKSTISLASHSNPSTDLVTEAQITTVTPSYGPNLGNDPRTTSIPDTTKQGVMLNLSSTPYWCTGKEVMSNSYGSKTSTVSTSTIGSASTTTSTHTGGLAYIDSSQVTRSQESFSNAITGDGYSTTASAPQQSVSSSVGTVDVNGNSSFASTESYSQSKSASFNKLSTQSSSTDSLQTGGMRAASSAVVDGTSSASHRFTTDDKLVDLGTDVTHNQAKITTDITSKSTKTEKPPVDTVFTASTVETLSRDTSSTVETLSTGTASTVDTLSTDTASTVETLSIGTTSTVETLTTGTASTVDTLSTGTASSVETLSIGTASTFETPSIGTASTVGTLSTGSASTVETPSTGTASTVETLATGTATTLSTDTNRSLSTFSVQFSSPVTTKGTTIFSRSESTLLDSTAQTSTASTQDQSKSTFTFSATSSAPRSSTGKARVTNGTQKTTTLPTGVTQKTTDFTTNKDKTTVVTNTTGTTPIDLTAVPVYTNVTRKTTLTSTGNTVVTKNTNMTTDFTQGTGTTATVSVGVTQKTTVVTKETTKMSGTDSTKSTSFSTISPLTSKVTNHVSSQLTTDVSTSTPTGSSSSATGVSEYTGTVTSGNTGPTGTGLTTNDSGTTGGQTISGIPTGSSSTLGTPTASQQTGTKELIGIILGCVLGTLLIIGICVVCRIYYGNRRRRNVHSDTDSVSTYDGNGSWRKTLLTRSSIFPRSEASTMMYKPSHEIIFPPVTYLPTYKVV